MPGSFGRVVEVLEHAVDVRLFCSCMYEDTLADCGLDIDEDYVRLLDGEYIALSDAHARRLRREHTRCCAKNKVTS